MSHNSTLQATAKSAVSTAQISLVATSTFLFLLTVMHFIKPEIDPSWRFISEYAIGNTGWLMMVAFLTLGISFIGLFIALKSHISRTLGGKIGLGLLLISAAGLILAGLFVTDPITATENEHTTSGMLHSIGGTLGMAIPFAVIFIYFALRKNINWVPSKRPVLLATLVAIAGFLFAFASLAIMMTQSEGKFGPEVLVGWPNRIEILCNCIWLLVIAAQAKRLHAQSN